MSFTVIFVLQVGAPSSNIQHTSEYVNISDEQETRGVAVLQFKSLIYYMIYHL